MSRLDARKRADFRPISVNFTLCIASLVLQQVIMSFDSSDDELLRDMKRKKEERKLKKKQKQADKENAGTGDISHSAASSLSSSTAQSPRAGAAKSGEDSCLHFVTSCYFHRVNHFLKYVLCEMYLWLAAAENSLSLLDKPKPKSSRGKNVDSLSLLDKLKPQSSQEKKRKRGRTLTDETAEVSDSDAAADIKFAVEESQVTRDTVAHFLKIFKVLDRTRQPCASMKWSLCSCSCFPKSSWLSSWRPRTPTRPA